MTIFFCFIISEPPVLLLGAVLLPCLTTGIKCWLQPAVCHFWLWASILPRERLPSAPGLLKRGWGNLRWLEKLPDSRYSILYSIQFRLFKKFGKRRLMHCRVICIFNFGCFFDFTPIFCLSSF